MQSDRYVVFGTALTAALAVVVTTILLTVFHYDVTEQWKKLTDIVDDNDKKARADAEHQIIDDAQREHPSNPNSEYNGCDYTVTTVNTQVCRWIPSDGDHTCTKHTYTYTTPIRCFE